MSTLTHEIVKHIFTKLGIVNDQLHQVYSSVKDHDFLLDQKINLLDEDDHEFSKNLWSCKLRIEDKDFRILLADCSLDDDVQEYALLISLQDSPEYGCYFSSTVEDSSICSFLNDNWVESPIYVQAAFLAGMEQIKDLSSPWIYNDRIDDLYVKLIAFIKYHDEVINER